MAAEKPVFDEDKESNLSNAIRAGRWPLVERLLEEGVGGSNYAIDADKCLTALHYAAIAEEISYEYVELLVRNGASLQRKNAYGKTPLDLFEEREHPDLEKIKALAGGKKPDLQPAQDEKIHDQTRLDLLEEQEHPGFEVQAPPQPKKPDLQLAAQKPVFDEDKELALINAIKESKWAEAQDLLDKGAGGSNYLDERGHPALQHAAENNKGTPYELVEQLVKNGANLDANALGLFGVYEHPDFKRIEALFEGNKPSPQPAKGKFSLYREEKGEEEDGEDGEVDSPSRAEEYREVGPPSRAEEDREVDYPPSRAHEVAIGEVGEVGEEGKRKNPPAEPFILTVLIFLFLPHKLWTFRREENPPSRLRRASPYIFNALFWSGVSLVILLFEQATTILENILSMISTFSSLIPISVAVPVIGLLVVIAAQMLVGLILFVLKSFQQKPIPPQHVVESARQEFQPTKKFRPADPRLSVKAGRSLAGDDLDDEKEDTPYHPPRNAAEALVQDRRDFATIRNLLQHFHSQARPNGGAITFGFESADEAYNYAATIERWLLDSDPSISKLKVTNGQRMPFFSLTADQMAMLQADVRNLNDVPVEQNKSRLNELRDDIRKLIVEPMNKNGVLSSMRKDVEHRSQLLAEARRLYKIIELREGPQPPLKNALFNTDLITVNFADDMQVFYDPIACKYTATKGLEGLANEFGNLEKKLLDAIARGEFDPKSKNKKDIGKAINKYNRPYQRAATARALVMSIELGVVPQTVLYDRRDQQPSPPLQAAGQAAAAAPPGGPSLHAGHPQHGARPSIPHVEQGDMFAHAQKCHQESPSSIITVHNLANDYVAGGGGSSGKVAQEEMFGRCSNLLLATANDSLNHIFFHGGNLYNRDKGIRHLPHFEDHIASITRGVTFFALPQTPENAHWKSSIYEPLDLKDRFQVNVLSNASRDYGREQNPTRATLRDKHRIQGRLAAQFYALEQERQKQPDWQENSTEQKFIGSAFGCGAFKNDPQLVAKWYAEAIEAGRYQEAFNIEFLVFGDKYRSFHDQFEKRVKELLAGGADEVKEGAPPLKFMEFEQQPGETDQAYAKRCTDRRSDHESQHSENVSSQNLQSVYAIKWESPTFQRDEKTGEYIQDKDGNYIVDKPGRWTFDIPAHITQELINGVLVPSAETLVELSGMPLEDCRILRADIIQDNQSTQAGQPYTGQNGDAAHARFLEWELNSKYEGVIGQPLGEGGYRLCIQTNSHFRARIKKQLQDLIKAGGNPEVLSLSEIPYDLDNDKVRQAIFLEVLAELEPKYVLKAYLPGRDVGIAVRVDQANNFKLIAPNSKLNKALTSNTNDEVALRGCAIEGNRKLCINIHADRVKANKGDPKDTYEKALDRYVNQLIKLKEVADEHAAKDGLIVHINGDTNLFKLPRGLQTKLHDAGYNVKPVMGQEKFDTPDPKAVPTCEAWIGAERPVLYTRQQHGVAAPRSQPHDAHDAAGDDYSSSDDEKDDRLPPRRSDRRQRESESVFAGHGSLFQPPRRAVPTQRANVNMDDVTAVGHFLDNPLVQKDVVPGRNGNFTAYRMGNDKGKLEDIADATQRLLNRLPPRERPVHVNSIAVKTDNRSPHKGGDGKPFFMLSDDQRMAVENITREFGPRQGGYQY